MPESLENQFISDFYTSLLHLSESELDDTLNQVFDGAGNSTGISLSGNRVVINNYIYPEGPVSGPTDWLETFFPVGCIQLTLDNISPQTRIAGTTWAQVAQGKFLVGVGGFRDKNNDFRLFCTEAGEIVRVDNDEGPSSGNAAGEYMTQLDIANLPPHQHDMNIGASAVVVSTGSSVGNGVTYQASAVGTTNSSVGWQVQQRRRNSLASTSGWNMANPFGNRGSDDGNSDLMRQTLDLNFQLGSAANYTEDVRAEYHASELKFKEVIGLWNGETRFVANTELGGSRDTPWRTFNAYTVCIELGAVDVGRAQAGELAVNQNVTPVVVRGTDQVTFNEGATNIAPSTLVGEGIKHNNIPPTYGAYMWQRIS